MLNFKNDARALDHRTLEALRLRAVRQVVENNESPEVVVKALGFHRSAIYKWLSAFEFGGYEALKARKLFGRPSILAKSQLKWIYNTVANKNPLQLNFEFALWTREIIRDAIQSKFKISPETRRGNIL